MINHAFRRLATSLPSAEWITGILAGLFYVDPTLVAGVLVLFFFNTAAAFWLAAVHTDFYCIRTLKERARRLGAYVLVLGGSIVFTRMAPILEPFRIFAFATVGGYEFVVMLAVIALIIPDFRPTYLRLSSWIREHAPFAPSLKEIEQEIISDDHARPN